MHCGKAFCGQIVTLETSFCTEFYVVDFSFTEEQQMLQELAARIAREKIAPSAADHDAQASYPLDNIRLLGENGLMGIEVPAQYGGAGMDPVATVLAISEIAAADAAHATIVSVNNSLFCTALTLHGSEQQRQGALRSVAEGRAIGAFALTEAHCGSDATAMRCRAERQADGQWKINGAKSWITSGPVADWVILFAVTDPAAGSRGISAFLIDTTRAGFGRGKKEPKMGVRASATCEITFDGYLATADELIGAEGQGFKLAMSLLDGGRIGIAAQAVGIARAAYEASVAYARERQAFGQAIGSFQLIQAKIADMKCKLEAATWLTLRAAWLKGQGKPFSTEAAVAKLTASEAAMWIAHQAVQIHGGMGYSQELPVERYFRDAKITEIYEGTSEIQRIVIARNETGLR